MSFRAWVLKRSLASILVLSCIAFQPAWGQAKNSPVAFANQDAITVSFVPAPTLGGSQSGSGTDQAQWMKVEVHYGTTEALAKDYPWVDSVQFKVWIEGLDLLAKDAPVAGKGVAVTLTGDVTYVNIAANKDLYGAVYVHPSALARYSGDRGQDDFDRKFNVHVEMYVGGVLMDRIDRRKEQNADWFKPLRAVPGFVLRQDQTPFIVADSDHYPMLKPMAAPAQ